MKTKSAISLLLLAFVLLGAAYISSVARLSSDMLVTQALTGSWWPVREVAFRTLQTKSTCAEEEFLPSSPLGFVIAAWENDVSETRYERLLDLLVRVGCDINGTGERGLTGLHSAVLFNNSQAVTSLLRRGADKYRVVTLPSNDASGRVDLDVPGFARYLNEDSGGEWDAVVEALELRAP